MDIDLDMDACLRPPDPDALATVIRLLRYAQETVPTPLSEDTVDGLLIRVFMTFHELISEILTDPVLPMGGGLGVPLLAGVHARTIADLLTVLAMQSSNVASGHDQHGKIEHAAALSERWLRTIVEVCCDQEEPRWHLTAASYVRIEAGTLSKSAQILRDEPRLSLDPDDPRLRVRYFPDRSSEETAEDAGVMLVGCAASALCMAAAVQPDFQFPPSPADAE
jgi:hypothetical protein